MIKYKLKGSKFSFAYSKLPTMLLNIVELLKVTHLHTIKVNLRGYNSKVPKTPYRNPLLTSDVKNRNVGIPTIELLERLSLVNFGNVKGVDILESSIKFAEQLQLDTTSVKPLISLLETEHLHLRGDVVTDGNCRKFVVGNAKVTEEEYFVAPPGNIQLEPQTNELFKESKTN